MAHRLSTGLAFLLAERVRAHRRRCRKRLARCREEFSEPAVHELRIEIRRLLSLLDLLQALGVAGDRARLRRVVKKRLDAFDELRDTHVQLSLLKPMWRDCPEARPLRKLLVRSETRAVTRLTRKLRDARLNRLNRRLKRLEAELHPRPGAVSSRAASRRQAATALRIAFEHVRQLRRRVRPDDTATIHRLRIAFKQYRYMSELLVPMVPWLSPRRLKWMKAYQDLAGNIQDLEVLLGRVTQTVKDRELPAADVRRLRRQLAQHQRKAVAAFLARIDDLLEFQPPEPESPGQPD